jgi:hypothetical protein
MKKLLVLVALLALACENSKIIDATLLLKQVPAYFFIPNTISKIKKNNQIISYTNNFNRLPNKEFSKFYLKKYPEKYAPYFNITINLSREGKITFEGVEIFKEELIPSLKEFIDFAAENKQTLLHLNFDEETTLNSFIEFTNFIAPIKSQTIQINQNVFIYNIESLPDCDCSL